jgi:hypothetical protein
MIRNNGDYMVDEQKNTVTTTIRVPRLLWKAIRIIAFDKNRSINSIVVATLTEKFGNEAKQT